MIRYLSILLLLICFQNQSFAKTGKGSLKLDKTTMEIAIMYMYGAGNKNFKNYAGGNNKHKPTIMAVSQDGWGYMYNYCPREAARGCLPPNAYQVIKQCEKYSNGSPCFIFAKKRRIVWKNGGPKVVITNKDLKSPYVVAKKIKEAGFYDGDIAELVGIDISTGQKDEKTKITGEKKDAPKITKKNKSADVVKELETLSNLYKSGVLSKDEFKRAKEKLLNN